MSSKSLRKWIQPGRYYRNGRGKSITTKGTTEPMGKGTCKSYGLKSSRLLPLDWIFFSPKSSLVI